MHSSSRFSPVHQLATWLNNEIATLYPGCFALVMATGIISNALFFEGYREWADTLFAVNLVAYPCLVLLTVLRFAWFSRALWADLINPRLVFLFLPLWPAPMSSASVLICAGLRPLLCSCGYSRSSSGLSSSISALEY